MNLGPSKEMPQYRCHKVVRAAKITAVEGHGIPYRAEIKWDSGVEVQEGRIGQPTADVILGEIGGMWTTTLRWCHQHKVEVGGYLVEYEDGYRSYSPAKAFEEGYVSLADDTKRRREAFDKAGYWPNEVMWKAWNQAWDAAQGKS